LAVLLSASPKQWNQPQPSDLEFVWAPLSGYTYHQSQEITMLKFIGILAVVATLINDFHSWETWSPWAKLDPTMKTVYSGAPSGVGSIYEWEGNSKVGKGRMEVTSIQPAKTSIKLDFLKPFEGHNTADFVLEPAGSGTRVTWVMYGPLNFIPGKLMSVFTTMDKMIGDDFQRGLANLKAAAEK
jgi:hypothetical protein